MDIPFLNPTREVAEDTFQFGAWAPLPGLGWLPVNSFIVRGEQPMLVDTHLAPFGDDLVREIGHRMDLAAVRWIWVTHMDADHIGNLARLLALCPQAQVVTQPLGQAKMELLGLPAERALTLLPGQTLDLGDRLLHAFAPPVFDAPETMGFVDSHTGAIYTSDCLGAVQERPALLLAEVEREALARGMKTWAHVDAPWLPVVDPVRWGARVDALAAHRPDLVLGSHLQPAAGGLPELMRLLKAAVALPEMETLAAG